MKLGGFDSWRNDGVARCWSLQCSSCPSSSWGARSGPPPRPPPRPRRPAAPSPSAAAPSHDRTPGTGDDPVAGRARDRPRRAPTPPAPSEFRETANLKDVFFDFDRYDIRPSDAKILDANATWLKTNDNLVLIEGHCDERGTNEYNLALGERRAKATMNYLVGQGIQANRITIISYGKERPICTENSEACWAKNRRAHFLVKAR